MWNGFKRSYAIYHWKEEKKILLFCGEIMYLSGVKYLNTGKRSMETQINASVDQ